MVARTGGAALWTAAAPLGQHEVELRGGALEGALERVEGLHVDLGAVEGAVTLQRCGPRWAGLG